MTGIVEWVDDAVESYMAFYRVSEFTRQDLAAFMGVDPDWLSYALQTHRKSQGRGGPRGYRPRYVVAGVGYARNAFWRVLQVPGGDPAIQRANRKRQARWTAEDIASRLRSDIMHDVRAGLRGAPDDRLIETALGMLQTTLEAQVSAVLAIL